MIHYSLVCVKAPCLDEILHATLEVYVMYMYETIQGFKMRYKIIVFHSLFSGAYFPLHDRRDS